jgi:hypothetical protein
LLQNSFYCHFVEFCPSVLNTLERNQNRFNQQPQHLSKVVDSLPAIFATLNLENCFQTLFSSALYTWFKDILGQLRCRSVRKKSVIKTGVIETGVIETGVIETGVIETGVTKRGLIKTCVIKMSMVKKDVIKIDVIKTGVFMTVVIKTGVIKTGDILMGVRRVSLRQVLSLTLVTSFFETPKLWACIFMP